MADGTSGSGPEGDLSTPERTLEIAAREHARRVMSAAETGERKNIKEALEFFAGNDSGQRDAFKFAFENYTVDDATKKGSIEGGAWRQLVNQWQTNNVSLEQAELFIQLSRLPDNEKIAKIAEIQSKLAPMPDDGKTGNEEVDTARRAQLEEAARQAMTSLENLPEDTPEEMKEYYRGRLGELRLKFKDLIHPDTTTGKFTRKLGKATWYLLFISFVFLVWEMNMIAKVPHK